MRRSLTSLALLALACGCSAIPQGGPPQRLGGGPPQPLPLRAVIASPTIALATDEEPKGYRAVEVLDPQALGREIAAWLRANELLTRVRASGADELAALRAEAWAEGEDLLVQVDLRELRAAFDGHNAWWIPNIINWLWWMVPAWFVATEEYSLSFEADLQVRAAATGQLLHQATLPIRVGGTFDEFDRGWQFFGFIAPRNDADNWRQIARALASAAGAALARAVSAELARELPAALARPDTARRLEKTLALVVGISHYEDAHALPPLLYAARDAEAVADALVAGGLDPLHVTRLTGSQATLSGWRDALSDWRERLRPGDQVVLYFAGYGSRAGDGQPRLLLYEAEGSARGVLSLGALAQALQDLPATALVLLDTSFDGQGRSVAGGRPEDPERDLQPLAAMGAAALAATSAGHPLRAPQHVGGSLFAHHLARALRGGADRDGDRTITPAELVAATFEGTVADSAYLGAPQRPHAVGTERRFRLSLRPGEGTSK